MVSDWQTLRIYLFTSKVERCFEKGGMEPVHADKKIYVRHLNSELALMSSAHMDDFKATGSDGQLTWLHELLKAEFGGDVSFDLIGEFEHTGIHHHVVVGEIVTMDQFQ